MKRYSGWYWAKLAAAVIAAVDMLAALICESTVGTLVVIAAAALTAMIYSDWRQSLQLAQEEWDAYMAELRQLDDQEADAAQSVEDARNQLFREFVGGYYGTR